MIKLDSYAVILNTKPPDKYRKMCYEEELERFEDTECFVLEILQYVYD
jgi:hypothetical protein